jgi:predicted PurR-regulated permease PerM
VSAEQEAVVVRDPEARPEVTEKGADIAPSSSSLDSRQADFAFATTVTGVLLLAGLLLVLFPHIVSVLLIAGLVSFALLPVVDYLDRWMPRSLAVAVVALGGAGLLVLIGLLVIPAAGDELEGLTAVIAQTRQTIARGWATLLDWLPAPMASWLDRFASSLMRGASAASPRVETLAGWARSTGASVAAVASGILFVPVFVAILLQGLPDVSRRATALIPPRWRARFRERGGQLNTVLGGFIRGQLLVAVVLGILYAAAFSLIGIPLAVFVGLIAGLGELVPYLGGAIALVLGSLMALAGGQPMDVLWVVATFVALQALEGTVISPWIVGSRARLGAGTVIVALAIGGQLFGILGLLLAVPVAAMLKVALAAALDGYRQTAFYARGAARPDAAP